MIKFTYKQTFNYDVLCYESVHYLISSTARITYRWVLQRLADTSVETRALKLMVHGIEIPLFA